eukprot:TRINITY_DN19258_c0_g1_i6.p1 TRINITY_DN19258_c0_g1~~TRINITY_DN19258_c0_g1_i6.p1  ORF type:complete len:206 (+),score=40.38 TRINITY_DN19258_c0_g1_i6:76-618(+)
MDTAGAGKSGGGFVNSGVSTYSFSADTAKGSFTHIVVYTKSSLVEQTTPAAVALADSAASASSVAWTDKDLDSAQIGGDTTWTLAADETYVSNYYIYLATDTAGAGKSGGGNVNSGVNTYPFSADTAKASFTHIVVYTKSSLVEQTTPAAVALGDSAASASSLAFADKDLDSVQIGGDTT